MKISVIRATLALLLLSFFASCGILPNPFEKESGDDDLGLLLLLGLAAGGGNRTVEETRPYRARTVSLMENGRIHVYDWNQDREVSLRDGDEEITGIEQIWRGESGRFIYAKVGNTFRVIDSTLNLSPHGDHFHFDRVNYYRTITPGRFGTELDAPTNTTPHSVYSREGWVAFFFKGHDTASVVKFVKENDIASEAIIPVVAGPTLGHGVGGGALLLSDTFSLVGDQPDGSGNPGQFEIYEKNGGPGWTSTGDSITCTNFQTIASTQVPVSGANFSDLNAGYNKDHYVLLSCGEINRLVTYSNGGADPTSSEWKGLFSHVIPVFNNDNIERGGRFARPQFLANGGTGSENTIQVLNANTKSVQSFETESYRSTMMGSETRSGNEAYILANNGRIITYGIPNGGKIREMDAGLSIDFSRAKFYSTWQAGFVTQGTTIHEYNIQESFKAREVILPSPIKDLAVTGFFAPGSDYEGPEH